MSLSVRCADCGTAYAAPDEYAGKVIRCRTCQALNRVPSPSVPPPKETSSPMISDAIGTGYRCPFCQSCRPALPARRWPAWRILLVIAVLLLLLPVWLFGALMVALALTNDLAGWDVAAPGWVLLIGSVLFCFGLGVSLATLLLRPSQQRLCPDCGQRVS